MIQKRFGGGGAAPLAEGELQAEYAESKAVTAGVVTASVK